MLEATFFRLERGYSLLAPEAQPDEIERSAHAEQEAGEGEVAGLEVLIGEVADPAPEDEPREHVAHDRPKGICLALACHGGSLSSDLARLNQPRLLSLGR